MTDKCPPILLLTNEELCNINDPLKSTKRIKYTCFNVSTNFLVFGATSGGLYVFRRDPCLFLQLLPNKEGAISHVSISPNEKLFAFSTVKGAVCVLERNFTSGARLVQISREHRDSEVTAMQWNFDSNELYIGDIQGRVSVLNILMIISKNLFSMPTFMMMKLDSRIVQLDWQRNLLLISTMTRCYICNTYKEEYRQVGKNLRDGEFGACIYNDNETAPQKSAARRERTGKFRSVSFDMIHGDDSLQDVKIFCSRPGSRLWEADVNGAVRRTHKLKYALALAPTNFVYMDGTTRKSGTGPVEDSYQHSFNFSRLYMLSDKYLFSYLNDGIYIFNPFEEPVVLWNRDFNDIADCQVIKDVVYVRLSSGHMHVLTLMPIEKILIELYLRGKYMLCAELCSQYSRYLVQQIVSYPKLHLLTDLEAKLPAEKISSSLSCFIQELSNHKILQQKNLQLKSGIFLVANKYALLNGVHEVEASARDVCLERKTRSLDTSPIRSSEPVSNELQKSSSFPKLDQILPTLVDNSSSECCDDYNNSDILPPFSVETIQAIKHFSNTMTDKINTGTKSLRETWHTLEGRVKNLSLDFPVEPLDVKCSGELPELLTIEKAVDVHLEDLNTQVVAQSKSFKQVPKYPQLDTSEVISVCDQLFESTNYEEIGRLTLLLFENIQSVYNNFVLTRITNQSNSAQISKNKHFPFYHYFSSNYSKIIREYFAQFLMSNSLITFLEKELACTSVSNYVVPDLLVSVHPRNSLDVDYLLSVYLSVYRDLVDCSTIIESIRKSELSCYYLTLCQLLDLYEEGALTNSLETNNSSSKRVVPSLLNAMFLVFKMGQAEICMKMGESVPLKEVLYLILRLQYQMIQSESDVEHALTECQSLFLEYIESVENTNVLTGAFSDKELGPYIISALERTSGDTHTSGHSCSCKFPVPCGVPPVSEYPNICYHIANYYWLSNKKQLYHVASKIPTMWYHILHLRNDEPLIDLLPLIIHIGDITELSSRLIYMDQGLWDVTLDLFARFHSGICLNCSNPLCHTSFREEISWTSLGLLMVESIGTAATLELLMKHELKIPPGGLDLKFYQFCIMSSVRMSRGRVGGRSLDSLNRTEENKNGNGVCPCCTLPLTHQSLLDSGGLKSFPCQHSYHTACLTQLTILRCIICSSLAEVDK